ncbi:sulfotransferase domain-containing protein, partial [bacterium]|nr:sulfotransferase domain-containing protein [bacterium]
WEIFSKNMKARQGLKDDLQCFYAEKVPHQVADSANELLDARSIFLLRDPRDEMVSIKHFNKKRGFHSFGWVDTDTDITYAKKMCNNRIKFLHQMISFTTTNRQYKIRYEDLIRKGPDEVNKLSEWLGLKLDYRTATSDKKIKSRHMTSDSTASSVERWKTELCTEVKELFANELGEELTQLGYSI